MNKKLKHITIRSAEINDVELLKAWWSDGAVMAHAGFPNGIETDKEKLKQRIINQQGKEDSSQLLVIQNEDYRIGEMNYRSVGESVYEVGIKICDKEERSKGHGRLCFILLLDHLFNTNKAKKVILDTNMKNTGAQKFYEGLGFIKVKENIDCWKDQLGNLQSAIDYEMTLDMYIKIKDTF